MHDAATFLRSALVDAIAGGHRLRREALREDQEASRWAKRATAAETRGLSDLAEAARMRSERHARMARVLQGRADEMQSEIDRLRMELRATPQVGRSPPVVDPIDSRFAELELEEALDRLRAQRALGDDPNS